MKYICTIPHSVVKGVYVNAFYKIKDVNEKTYLDYWFVNNATKKGAFYGTILIKKNDLDKLNDRQFKKELIIAEYKRKEDQVNTLIRLLLVR